MSKLNGRKVLLVRTHSVVHVPGIGQLKPAIDANSAGLMGQLELEYQDSGCYVSCVAKNIYFYISPGNIISMNLAPESNSKKA